MSRIGRERGWPGLTRAQFEAGRAPNGHLTVGTPAEAIAKILAQHAIFGHQRYLMQMRVGHDAARGGHALDRAVRDGGRAGGAPGAGLKKRARPPKPQ